MFLAVIGVVLTIVFTLADVALARTDMELLLAMVAGVLYATGLYLMLRRRLAQLIIGLGLLANGSNILIFAAAGVTRAKPPLILRSRHDGGRISSPIRCRSP